MTYKTFLAWIKSILKEDTMTPNSPVEAPKQPLNASVSVSTPNPDTLVPWDTEHVLTYANYHNCRVLADLCGLSFEQKETMCATIWGESEFATFAKNTNYAFNSAGIKYVASTDAGICQWNDVYHGSEITPDQATNDPEMAVRLMCSYWLAGRMNQWCAYSSGRYKQFVGKIPSGITS